MQYPREGPCVLFCCLTSHTCLTGRRRTQNALIMISRRRRGHLLAHHLKALDTLSHPQNLVCKAVTKVDTIVHSIAQQHVLFGCLSLPVSEKKTSFVRRSYCAPPSVFRPITYVYHCIIHFQQQTPGSCVRACEVGSGHSKLCAAGRGCPHVVTAALSSCCP